MATPQLSPAALGRSRNRARTARTVLLAHRKHVAHRVKHVAHRGFHALPRICREYLLWLLYDRRIASQPDRRFLEEQIIPFLASTEARSVLFVGCRAYTSHYPRLFEQRGMTLTTCDIDPRAERFGSPGRHRTIDVCELPSDIFPARFDAIVFNGVVGFGVDTIWQVEQAGRALASVLDEGGLLVCGSNTDRGVDPSKNPVWQSLFERSRRVGVAERVSFAGSTHVFDVFERRRRS